MKDNTENTVGGTKIPKQDTGHKLSKDGKWRSFPKVPNLLQYVSTGSYFARTKVNGKIIRLSLETDVKTTAKLKLPDFLKKHSSKKAVAGAPVTFADAQRLYEEDLANDHAIGDNSKRYRRYCIKKLNGSWLELGKQKLDRITEADCKEWAGRFAPTVDEQYFNNVLGTLRLIFNRGGLIGADDPATRIQRLSVEIPVVNLPTLEQFEQVIREMETSGAGQQQHCADFARFLSFSGCRLSEAKRVFPRDVDMTNGITVHSGKVRKAGKVVSKTRIVPIIQPMRKLLKRILKDADPDAPLLQVGECEKSLARACKIVGVPRLTHHKLRDLFATIAIESGVDVPTVADWLGHSDGGALLLKRYRKHRPEHSLAMAKKVSFSSPVISRKAA